MAKEDEEYMRHQEIIELAGELFSHMVYAQNVNDEEDEIDRLLLSDDTNDNEQAEKMAGKAFTYATAFVNRKFAYMQNLGYTIE